MSTSIKKDLACPQCGESGNMTLYTGINCVDNPDLKKKILEESLFDYRCPRCGYGAQMSYPLVYHDPDRGYMIALYRLGSKRNKVESNDKIAELTKRRVKSLRELKEKIKIFDAGLDDIAVELVKNALSSIIVKTYGAGRVRCFFSRKCEDGSLEFAIFLPGREEPVYHATKPEVYEQSAEVLRALNYAEPNEFLRVGSTLAHEILESYKTI